MISSRISEGTFRPPRNLFLRLIWRLFRPLGPWCFAVSEPPARTSLRSSRSSSSRPSSCNRFVFTRIQKGRQASGQHVFGGRSVLQGHGALLFRNRPLGLCCGAVLRAWEQLQQHHQQQSRPSSCNRFVFTRIQKGRQASGQHVFGGRSVLQGHGVLLFRNRPLGLRCGAVLRAWE